MFFANQFSNFFLLLAIGVPSSVIGDWSCYDISGSIAGNAHACICEAAYCNENACVNAGGIWAENCNSCHCDGVTGTGNTGLAGDGCYDSSINQCSCDPSVCSESSCSASGGSWANSCNSCQCAGTAAATGGGDAACFSEWATAEVLRNNAEQESMMVAMKDLRVGDRVKTATGRYESVYAFAHFHETKIAPFFRIQTTAPTAPLEVTGDHLIFVDGKKNPVRVDSIRVGDVLHHRNGFRTATVVVTDISKVFREGIYAPLTSDGTIVVNEIVASAYGAISVKSTSENIEIAGWSFFGINQADAIHLTLSPLRILCNANGSTFDICKDLDNETRMNKYVACGIGMIQWGEMQNVYLQVILMVLGLLAGAFISVLEKAYSLDYFFVASILSLIASIRFHRCYSMSSKISNTV